MSEHPTKPTESPVDEPSSAHERAALAQTINQAEVAATERVANSVAAHADLIEEPLVVSREAVPPPQGRSSGWQRVVKPLAGFFGVQMVVQILMMLAGLLVVRTMDKSEYAFYTVANATQGSMSVLTNLGATSALSALGGVVWRDKKLLGQLLNTALAIRVRFEAIAAVFIVPLLIWLLRSHDCPWPATLIITAGIIATVHYQVSGQVFTMVPRLHAQLGALQRIDLITNGSRFIIVVLLAFVAAQFFNATVITVVGLGAFVLQTMLARRAAVVHADFTAPTSQNDKISILKVVRQQAPTSIYYALQGQVTILIISLFGSTQNVAEVGALGRLALILGVVTSVLSNIAMPRFARTQNPAQLKKIYALVMGSVIGLGFFMVMLSVLFPGPFLWILGKQYANLDKELPFMIFASATNMIGGTLVSLNSSRAWLKNVWWSIPTVIVTQLALLPFLNLSSIRDVILLSCLPPIASWLVYLHRAYVSFREFETQQAAH